MFLTASFLVCLHISHSYLPKLCLRPLTFIGNNIENVLEPSTRFVIFKTFMSVKVKGLK